MTTSEHDAFSTSPCRSKPTRKPSADERASNSELLTPPRALVPTRVYLDLEEVMVTFGLNNRQFRSHLAAKLSGPGADAATVARLIRVYDLTLPSIR